MTGETVANKLKTSAAKASKAVRRSKAGKGIGKFARSPIGKTLIAEGIVLGAVALARSSRVRKTTAGAGAKAARVGKASAAKAGSVGKAAARTAAHGVKSAAGSAASAASSAASRFRKGRSKRAKALADHTAETIETSPRMPAKAPAPAKRRKSPAKKPVRKR